MTNTHEPERAVSGWIGEAPPRVASKKSETAIPSNPSLEAISASLLTERGPPVGCGVERHFRRPDVEKITGLSTASIYRLMKAGTFPRPLRMSQKTVAWRESDLAEYLRARKDAA